MGSVFENLKESICDSINACKNLTQLRSKLNEIPEEFDLEED